MSITPTTPHDYALSNANEPSTDQHADAANTLNFVVEQLREIITGDYPASPHVAPLDPGEYDVDDHTFPVDVKLWIPTTTSEIEAAGSVVDQLQQTLDAAKRVEGGLSNG